jgi:site-specific DNA recombinase
MLLGYTRVSSVEQASDDKTSLEEQERVIRGYAMMKGYTQFEVSVYSDPGISAGIALRDRPSGKRLLEDAKKGDVIICSKFDRLFRSARDAVNMSEIFREKGIDLICFNMGDSPVNGNGIGQFFFTLMAAVAQLERTLIKERTADGKRAKKLRGGHVCGKAPYGFRVEGRGPAARLIAVEAEQKVIQTVREWKEQYEFLGVAATARALNEAGFAARNGKPFLPMQASRLIKQVENERAELRKALQGQMPVLQDGNAAQLSNVH